jgi:hypothetical protein
MNDRKAWYESKSVWGSIVTLASMGAALGGAEVSDLDQARLAELLMLAGGTTGAIVSLVGRIVATDRIG